MPRDRPVPSLSAELFALTQAAAAQSESAKRDARAGLSMHMAYQRMFFDEGGNLREEARLVLEDITEEAAIGKASPSIDFGELAVKEGKRRLALHIFGRLQISEERLRQFERQLMQEEDNAG